MSNPFSQLNGYKFTNPYNSTHTGYNGFTGPPGQQQNNFQSGGNLSSNRFPQFLNNPGQVNFSNRRNSEPSEQSERFRHSYNPPRPGLNGSFVQSQAPNGPLGVPSQSFTPGSPAFPPASPLFNPPAISPGFPSTAVYAPVLSPITPPGSNSASPNLRRDSTSQVNSVPSRAKLNPLEELEAVTKQISREKSGQANLDTSGSSHRALSPSDQFVQDLLNGKDSNNPVSAKDLPTNSNPPSSSQTTLSNHQVDPTKPGFSNTLNPAFVQNNFPSAHQGSAREVGPLLPNSGFPQYNSLTPNNSHLGVQNNHHYNSSKPQSAPVQYSQASSVFPGSSSNTNGRQHSVPQSNSHNHGNRTPLLSPLRPNQFSASFQAPNGPQATNSVPSAGFNQSQAQLQSQLQRQQQELQEKQHQLQTLRLQTLNQQRFQQAPIPPLQPLPRNPSSLHGHCNPPLTNRGLPPSHFASHQVVQNPSSRPGLTPRSLNPQVAVQRYPYQGRSQTNFLSPNQQQQGPDLRPLKGPSQRLQYLQSNHPQIYSAYQQRFGNSPQRLPVNVPRPLTHPIRSENSSLIASKHPFSKNRNQECVNSSKKQKQTTHSHQKKPSSNHSQPVTQHGVPPQSIQPQTDSVVRVEISPNQLNKEEQQEAWKRAEAFLKSELTQREQNLNDSLTSEGSWHQPEEPQIRAEQLNLPPGITVEKSSSAAQIVSSLPETVSNESIKRERRNSAPDINRVIDVQQFLRERAESNTVSRSPLKHIKRERLNSDPTDSSITNGSILEGGVPVKSERLSPVISQPLYTPANSNVETLVSTANSNEKRQKPIKIKIKGLRSEDYVLETEKSSIFGSLDLELQSLINRKESESTKVKQEQISPLSGSATLEAPRDYCTFAAEANRDSVFETESSSTLVNFSSEISETRGKELVHVKAKVPAHPTSTPSAQIPISDCVGVDLADTMSGNPPKLPPGISLQRTPATPAPNLPPGISIQRSGDSPQIQKLPSSIQVQRSDSNESKAGMDRLAGLGIQISRSEDKTRNNDMDRLSRLGISVSSSGGTQSSQNNKAPIQSQVPDRLSGLGISVSGGPKPQGISISGGPRLPPGVNVTGGPKTPNLPPGINISGGPTPNLPPGVNISGGPKPAPNLPPGMSISGGPRPKEASVNNQRPNLPAGVQISGGPRPNLPPGVNISGGPRPANQSNMRGGAPRSQTPRLPPGVQISGGPTKKPDTQANGPQNEDKDDEDNQDSEDEENEESPKENGSVSEKDDQVKTNSKEDDMDTEEDEGSLKVAEEEVDKDKKSTDQKTDDTQENGEKEEEDAGDNDVGKNDGDNVEADHEEEKEADEADEKNKESDKKEEKAGEKDKKSKSGENGTEEEGWEGYEGEEGWEGYEGEEGWEGYEGEEGWEGYEGEEGWEGYEGEEGWEEGVEKSKENKENKDKKNGQENDETEKHDSNKEKSGKVDGKEDGEIEKEKTKDESKAPNTEDEETYEEDMDDDDDQESSKNNESASKESLSAQPGLGSLGNISISRLSKEDEKPKNKLPPGISMSPVPSMPNLPPGISISSPAGNSGPPSNLPPGISISPFKKPSSSARHSVDDDSRSNNSMDRENSFYREDSDGISDGLSISRYSDHMDHEPLVGIDTICVFCNRKCADIKPKLLTCLHSACSTCFDEKIRISIRDNSANDVVDLDGDDIQMAPEVTCPICKATTNEDEVMDNYFASTDDGEHEDTSDEDQHICVSCEENAIATSKCNDCEEYLCNDCVRAHLRVKMTKDHEITVVATSANSTTNLNYCDVHRNEKLTLFCESCDTLNCRDCQLSERHRNHKYRYSHEVAPEIKAQLMQSVSDTKLKRNGLEESRQLLSTKLQEVNIKENSLLGQLREVKSYLVSKIENRHKELEIEISKVCREKRKLLEGRKSTLDRTYWQADYGITFVNNVLSGNVSDEKILLTKRMMSRQMKRLRRANNSVNLSPLEMEMKLDLYFQHFTGQSLHTNLDSVLKMVMSDIKVSSTPIEPPKPKPPPAPAAPSPVRQPPTTPTRGVPQSPGGVPRNSPARLNSGMVNRNLGTPQKQIVARSPGGMRQPSPVRPMMQGNRNMQGQRMGGMQPRMAQPVRGGRGRGQMVQGGVRMGGQQGMVGGRGQMARGRAPIRGAMVGNQGMARGGNQQMIRGRGVVRGGIQQVGMRGGVQPMRGGAMNRGGMQIRGQPVNKPRMIQPAIAAPGARRGRPPSGTSMGGNQPLTYNPTPRSQNPQSFANRGVKPAAITNMNTASSWHTPTTANRPVSPPKSSDASNFKIKLPKLGGGLSVKSENDDLISLDEPPAKIVRPNNGSGNVTDALATLNRTGIQISRQDEGVDPLSGDQGPNRSRIKTEMRPNSNHIQAPDFSMLVDDEISNSPEWIQQPSSEGDSSLASLNIGAMKSEHKGPSAAPIKIEGGQGTAKSISQPTSRPIMEGSGQKEKADGDWCAVCHDGGDTLYCCDRCPKVYHLFCYVPPLTSEPPDDWVCLMCATIDEILSLPTKVKKGRGNLSERDLKLCRRLLFEMYNLWPESVPFRDCADLNFPQYLEKIKDPIALDVIKERLDEENPDQYSSVREFLADLRKMFRNCFLFNSKESEIYRHAKKLEEKLDQLLQMWLPEFAFDPLTDLVDKVKKSTKRPTSPQPGPSKKKRSNDTGVDFLGKSKDKKKKKKKRKRKHSDDNRSESDSDDISEGERERQDYLAALQMSLQGGEDDNDPRDGDFMPEDDDLGKGKGKGKGRGKGKRAAS